MAHEGGSPGPLVGAGGSSEVFDLGDGTVLKLFRAAYGGVAEQEVARTEAVRAAGVAAPAVVDRVTWEGRVGIVMERIDAPTLLEDLLAGRRAPAEVGRLTAEAQTAFLDRTADLPGLHEVVPGLPSGTTVVHLDLHPGNVLATPTGLVVIDWVNAHLAPAGADVARSILLIRHVALGRMGSDDLDAERATRQAILDGYLAHHEDRGGLPADRTGWLGPLAARVLADEPGNPDRPALEEMVAAGWPAPG